MNPKRHGPNAITNYFEIHETVMQQYMRDGFVEVDGLSLTLMGGGNFRLDGYVVCEGGLVCRVDKTLEVVDGSNPEIPIIQTVKYTYNVSLSGVGNIFRYDNTHVHAGHVGPQHRHEYVVGTTTSTATYSGPDWPHLGEVFEEMRVWHWENLDRPRPLAVTLRPK